MKKCPKCGYEEEITEAREAQVDEIGNLSGDIAVSEQAEFVREDLAEEDCICDDRGFNVYDGDLTEYENYLPAGVRRQVFCAHDNCYRYIKGTQQFGSNFIAETGQEIDVDNECWMCEEHCNGK